MPVKSGKEPARGVYTPLQMETNKSPMMMKLPGYAVLSVRSSSLLLSVPSLHQHWNASSTMLSAFWPHIPSFQNVLMRYWMLPKSNLRNSVLGVARSQKRKRRNFAVAENESARYWKPFSDLKSGLSGSP